VLADAAKANAVRVSTMPTAFAICSHCIANVNFEISLVALHGPVTDDAEENHG